MDAVEFHREPPLTDRQCTRPYNGMQKKNNNESGDRGSLNRHQYPGRAGRESGAGGHGVCDPRNALSGLSLRAVGDGTGATFLNSPLSIRFRIGNNDKMVLMDQYGSRRLQTTDSPQF